MSWRTALRVAPVAALALAVAAEASTTDDGLIRWSYVEEILPLTHVNIGNGSILPFEIPATAGPLLFSFDLDPADFPDLGRAPVVLSEIGGIADQTLHINNWYNPVYHIQNITVSANAMPALGEIWDMLLMRLQIGTDGAISTWNVNIHPSGRNSELHFSNELLFPSIEYLDVRSNVYFHRTSLGTPRYYAGFTYSGSGGSWTRTGGDALFAASAPVPLPAPALMLLGGQAGLGLLRRRAS